MKYLVLLTDRPDANPDIRRQHMPDHMGFLEANSKFISAAGPLKDVVGVPSGGAWLVDAPTVQDVEILVHSDPLWFTGLRAKIDILEWHQVFANGICLIET